MLTVSLFMQTSEEVYEKMTGLVVPMTRERNFTMALDNSVQRLPKYLDYRKKKMVTSVKNQVRDHLAHISPNYYNTIMIDLIVYPCHGN